MFRRSPTANSGLVQVQETESHATHIVDSRYEVEAREAQATREMKRKLNPFLREETDEREASATRKLMLKGHMPSERTRGLALPKPLTLEQCVTLLMSPSGVIQNPKFLKTDSQYESNNTSSNSDSGKPHAALHDRLIPHACILGHAGRCSGSVGSYGSGETLFSRADALLSKGESTFQFDCNTVGPVPVASGYDPRTLMQSAAHVLNDSKENASSLQCEVRLSKVCGTPVVESRDRGTKMTSFTGNNLQSVKDGALKRQKAFNSMPKSSCFTGSTVSVMPQDQMDRTRAIGAMPKSSHFTIAF